MNDLSENHVGGEVATLVQLLEHQRSLYRRLRMLAERQRSLVMMDDHRPLLDLLAERQKLVDGLVSLVSQMAPYRSRWTQIYQELDEGSRRRVTLLLEEVNASLSSILQSDSHDTAALMARKDHMAQQISTMNAGRHASAAYAVAGSAGQMLMTDAEA